MKPKTDLFSAGIALKLPLEQLLNTMRSPCPPEKEVLSVIALELISENYE